MAARLRQRKSGEEWGWVGWRVGVGVVYGLLWVVVWWGRGRMPPEFPIFYSLPYGEEQLGTWEEVVRITGLVGLVVGWGEVAGWWLRRRNYGVLGKIVSVVSGWAVLIWAIALVRVYWLVGW